MHCHHRVRKSEIRHSCVLWYAQHIHRLKRCTPADIKRNFGPRVGSLTDSSKQKLGVSSESQDVAAATLQSTFHLKMVYDVQSMLHGRHCFSSPPASVIGIRTSEQDDHVAENCRTRDLCNRYANCGPRPVSIMFGISYSRLQISRRPLDYQMDCHIGVRCCREYWTSNYGGLFLF